MLTPLAFVPLPIGSIRPAGWLLNQLRLQAAGLSGHLDEFWPDIADSGWIGGNAEGWERVPYWLDGLVPLAFLLDDSHLKVKVKRWMDYIIEHQHADGWLGPAQFGRYEAYDPWPQFVILKALLQYEQAGGDPRVIPTAMRALRRTHAVLDERPLFDWGKSRWQDLVLSAHALYERTGESWLLDLAAKAHEQGFDWRAHFADFRFTEKTRPEECAQPTHVVNNAMGVKAAGVWYRQSHDPADRESSLRMIATLDRYHGQATGLFTGDEHYAGLSPSQGTELCAVVEYMFSLEVLLGILGEPALADRLERIAFNALPATLSPDMWAHQYDQQANQVICRVAEDRVYTSNGPDSNIFGLEPNYGCCTADLTHGWPKLAAHLWMATPDGGLAAMSYAPCTVDARVADRPVRIEVVTDYPFDDRIDITIRAADPVEFPLRLRVPEWTHGADVSVDEAPAQPLPPGEFHDLRREWGPCTKLTLRLPMPVRVERRFNDAVAIHRGPLVYSLAIGEDWRQVGGDLPHADWEVYPTTPWNYALRVDPADPERSIRFERRAIGPCPFSPEGAPVIASVMGRRLPEWGIEHNAAAPPPRGPLHSDQPIEPLTLLPYGCTGLRVTELPLLAD